MRGWRRWRTERAAGPVRTGKAADAAATDGRPGAARADRQDAAAGRTPRPARGPRAWREARADLPAFACLGVLVAVLAAVATAAPPLLDRAAGRALVDRIAAAQDERPLLTRTVTFAQPVTGPAGEGGTRLADDLEQAGVDVTTGSPDALDGLFGEPAHQALVPAATLDAPRGTAALSLLHTTEAPGPAGYAAGRPPRDTGPGGPVEIAVSTRTRDALGLRLGQELTLTPRVARLDTPVVVTGFLRPDPAARLWRGNPLLAEPLPADRGPVEARALIAPGALDVLLDRGLPQLTVEWRLRLEVAEADEERDEAAARFAGDDGRAALIRALAAYDRASADNFCATTGSPLCVYGSHPAERPTRTDEVQPLVRDFDAEWDQAATVVSFALASVVGVGLAAALVTSRLAVRRRLGEHRLRRARGASAAGLAFSRAAQYAPVAGAALAAGYAGARLALPGGAAPPVWPAAAVAVAAWLALPALTWAAVRDRRPGPRRRRGSAGRRLTAEAAVLLLAGAGVWALRVRGTAGSGASDPLVAAVPLLCGLAVVVLLIRAYPPPLRLLARLAARRRGPLGLLALSRAARDAPAAVLALLVLVATLGAAVFGGLVTGTVEEGRRDALEWRTGGAAAVLTDAAGPAADEALRRTPGVAEAVRVRLVRTDLTSAATGLGQRGADVLAVDGAALRRADPGSAAAAAVAGLGAPRRDGAGRLVLPVLAGGERGEARTGETYETEWPGVRVRVAGRLGEDAVRDAAFGPLYGPRGEAPGADRPLLLADTAALAAADRERAADTPRGTAAVLYYGTATPAALRAAAPGTGYGSPYGELLIAAEERAADRDDGVLGAIRGAHALCAALAAALALLTLLVELLLSAPERARTTACLRLLGLGRRGATALGVLQLAPFALAAAAGGLALGLALPAALGPALDLQALTGGPTAPARHPDHLLTAALTVGLLALVAAAAAADAVTTRRTRRLAALRLGEDR
ncbi:FtsX-like permease family protein [Streptomyces sp. WAC 06738]|uniref:FtsX-like permease family protein n=1 Tax=Streptomyces sp. WAC 06738 TaxID=2203210 RepID=UPI0019D308A8|nr:FtsX-like permease family protein [Streptomyces sp. WAC 06738]